MSGHLGAGGRERELLLRSAEVYFWISEKVLERDYAEGGTTL